MPYKNSSHTSKSKGQTEDQPDNSTKVCESASLRNCQTARLSDCKTGRPIFILHGLFDCTLSWQPIADQLSSKYNVHLLPLRNHRDAKRFPTMSFDEMADDIKLYADENGIEKFIFVGHSLGGKTAMQFALKYPQMIKKLIVVDISPCRMSSLLEPNILTTNLLNQVMAIKNLPLSDFHSLAGFANGISSFDKDTKRAIVGNMKYDGKSFSWHLDINAIFNNFDKLTDGFDVDNFIDNKIEVPTLFIRALDSEYLPSSEYKAVRYIFSNSEIVEVAKCTHRIHLENPQKLSEIILKYIDSRS